MNYHKIDNCNMNNGDGVRVVLWVSGCSHHCRDCFNEQTWKQDSGELFTDNQLSFILDSLQKDWCTGLTLSGGDPLFENNLTKIYEICGIIKKKYPQKTIWIYSGYTYEEAIKNPLRKKILEYCDVMVDGRFISELKSPDKQWVGSSNQRIIDIPQTLKEQKIILL